MNESEIRTIVFATVADQFNIPVDQLSSESLLIEDLGADSAALVEFSVRLEDTFNTEFPDLRFLADKDLGELIKFISTYDKLAVTADARGG